MKVSQLNPDQLLQNLHRLSQFLRRQSRQVLKPVFSPASSHRLVPHNLLQHHQMTDLVSPPEDLRQLNPDQQLQWARRVLREFWRKENRGLLGAKEIRSLAREIINKHRPPSQRPRRQRQPNQPQLPLT